MFLKSLTILGLIYSNDHDTHCDNKEILSMKKIFLLLIIIPNLIFTQSKIFIPMDLTQSDHLKAYGITFNALKRGLKADWLLNYKGGSFMLDYSDRVVMDCRIRNVDYKLLDNIELVDIYSFVQSDDQNMDVVRLEKAPEIAVYVPPGFQPWDDAVTLAMEYAEVEYDKIWIKEILTGKLSDYDWLHLHHEDFTGQFGKFYSSYRGARWYQENQLLYENEAAKFGYKKVSEMEKEVVKTIKSYIGQGGFLFAMCSATDSYDIALVADQVDIADKMFDGDAPDQNAQAKLDFNNSLAFEKFNLEMNPMVYEYSDIDIQLNEIGTEKNDYFSLFDFSAKFDPVPTMLTQNHVNVVKGFMGQTTMFRKSKIKNSVIILAERAGADQVKYIHGKFGRGTFTFYGGHDPEDYRHAVNDPQTELSLYKNSPGYRLILNNILFPTEKKKKQKT